MNTKLSFVILFYVLNFRYISEAQESCRTPTDEDGQCISLQNCDSLKKLLATQSQDPKTRWFLKQSACGGYVGRYPNVCCGAPKLRTPVTPAENSCGISPNQTGRIVGGYPAVLGEYPWIVALGYKNANNPNSPKWLCGATLITKRHVLTAGHCVYNRKDLYLARVGELILYDDNDGAHPEDIRISKAKIHEQYSRTQFFNDIAVLTLERPVTNPTVVPICLPVQEQERSNTFSSYNARVAGWGSIYFNGPSSSALQVLQVPVLDNKHCYDAYHTRAVVDERIICAGFLEGGKDACKGDSGGPLMAGRASGGVTRFLLIGVVSYGQKCAEAGFPGVYTRVTHFIDWIQDNTK